MEIKINKEIRAYQENIFFGLSTRQFICSMGAVGIAVGMYFLLEKPLGKELVSWVCIVSAAPFAAAGFFQYNGLTVERFLVAWFKTTVIGAGRRVYRAENIYYKAFLDTKKKTRRTKYQNKKEGSHHD